MTNKDKQSIHRERVVAEQLMHGNLFAAAPGLRELARITSDEIEQGLSETEARRRIRSRMESEGLTLRRQLLPGLTRKLLRVNVRKLLHALAEVFANRITQKKLGPALDSVLDKVGFDQWLEDFVWTYASTGEAPAMMAGYSGTVYRSDIGEEGDKTPTVWMVATPASDTQALIEWFKEEADKAFPDETFAKRHGASVDGARYYRMNQEGMSFAEIAHENVYELYPDLCASDDEEEFDFYTKLVKRETERVKKLAHRTYERGDTIALYKSPEE